MAKTEKDLMALAELADERDYLNERLSAVNEQIFIMVANLNADGVRAAEIADTINSTVSYVYTIIKRQKAS